MKTPLVAAALLASVGLGSPRSNRLASVAPTPCEQLASLKLENTVLTSVERVTRGTFNVRSTEFQSTRSTAFLESIWECTAPSSARGLQLPCRFSRHRSCDVPRDAVRL
jgi:hypothetical protein